MQLKTLKVRQGINKAYLKVKPNRTDIDQFKASLIQLIDRTNDVESEEFHKNLIADFLKETYYSPSHFINTKGRNDLVIHNGKDPSSSVGVIIEAKKPTNKTEMLSKDNINYKAFQELILYYLRERIFHKNLEIKYLIATNINEWFIFDAAIFEKLFAQSKTLVKQFEDFEAERLSGTKTEFFYTEIAKPFVEGLSQTIEFTYVDLRNYEKPLRNNDKKDDAKLIALFKLLSPEHLLKLPFANDSNSLDKKFYSELLHIIGLSETKDKGKKVIGRSKAGERHSGTLLENAITQIDSHDKLSRLPNPSAFGANKDERLFNVGLELCITWVNRILFLKLLEAQLVSYHSGEKDYTFLNQKLIKGYDDLDKLFFQVLARKHKERSDDIQQEFGNVPYLNSSLFEPTEIEHKTLFISNLGEDKTIPILSNTVLKSDTGKKRTGELGALEYLFEFLEAYDFSSEGSEDIQEENKTLISASVLGLIFEKINGYKDGSFFTPGFITMYMCRETIRRAVVQKFNETKGWTCEALDDLYDRIEDRKEANELVNSIKLCDPAVGSGHFLVSALNEILSIKSDLKILQDREGKRLKEYVLEVVNDELIVTDDDGELFEYHYSAAGASESQRVQETLFHEKQTIIENCLFGVDINPNSVKICRLRLWIELLKSAYYKNKTELETLPNIDINIKCGNSLISRFDLDSDLKEALKSSKWSIDSYRSAVDTYRNAQNKEQKKEMEQLMEDIKNDFRSEINKNDPKVLRLKKLSDELVVLTTQTSMFEQTAKEKKEWKAKTEKLTKQIKKLETEIEEIKSNKIYENAFEWRFEFPEVLNDQGDFVGFDVVIGNPPWGASLSISALKFIKSWNADIIVRMIDTFMFFVNLSFRLKGNKGIICQIVPDVILYQIDNIKLREKILKQFQLHLAVNLGDNIFEDVARPSCIILISEQKNNITDVFEYKIKSDVQIDEFNKNTLKTSFFSSLPNKIFATRNLTGYQILSRFKDSKLFDLIDSDGIQRGISPDLKEAFIVTQEEINSFSLESLFVHPTVTGGRDLDKYYAKDIGKRIIYTKKTDDEREIKNIIRYLSKYQNKITCKEVKQNKHPFWSLHRARAKSIFDKKEKILGVITSDRIITSIDTNRLYPTDGIYLFSANEKYSNTFLVGLLNSKLITYLYRLVSMEESRTLAQIKPSILKDLPVSLQFDKNAISKLETKTNQILSLKKENPKADTSKLEAEIDQMVYELYGLTEEEIKIVEESVG
ncbi:MAG: TaqI-like C-terminal specificity domain-containing protein [Balneolaceae bacterium]